LSRSRILAAIVALAAGSTVNAGVPDDLELVRWPNASTSFSQPIGVRHAGDGTDRVFIVERCGTIRIVKNGAVLATPFLSVSVSCGGELGLLGLAFDPDFATNGTFYVSYSNPGGSPNLGSSADHVLARYTAPIGSDVANPTGTVVMRVPDLASNHNGGDLHFGHDDYLYWSIGDGGPQGDPHGFAQCTGRKKADNTPGNCYNVSGGGPTYYLLGKIVRIDPRNTTASAPANYCGATAGQPAQYSVPAGNPFANAGTFPNDCAEVFNWGFRNPFRFSFDRANGAMLIGDVGQNVYEEVSYQAAGSPGQNFQWKACEGFHTYPGGAAGCTGPAGSIPPKLAYSHAGGNCSVTGGYIYRGPIAALQGTYIFADYCSARFWTVAGTNPATPVWTYQLLADTPAMSPYSFGEDGKGNLYVTSGSGPIYRFASGSGGATFEVTPVAGPGGSITPPGVQVVPEGEITEFTVTADSGFTIAGVTGCGGSLAGSIYTTGPITANCTVTATFEADPVSYTVTPTVIGGGSIDPSTPQTVEEDDIIEFTLAPDPDFVLESVTGCDGSLDGSVYTTGPIIVDCEVVATFTTDKDLIFENGFEVD
jgi:glucose/arabinose dehydrogenase